MAKQTKTAEATETTKAISIKAPDIRTVALKIVGTSPMVQCKFSEKAKRKIADTQTGVIKSSGKKVREKRDFDDDFRAAQHVSEEGWIGIPASAFRKAMVDACRLTSLKMTLAKMSIFIESDGLDKTEGTPLVKITKGKPELHMAHTRNATGVVDLRARPMWKPGWEAVVRVRYDADQFSDRDVANLMMRVGAQVGIGEGRAFSRESCGQGWGFFAIAGE